MSFYILKTIICAALFLGIYYMLLEKEKMLRFNRAYLLLAILLSFCVPLITFTTEIKMLPVLEKIMTEQPDTSFIMAEPLQQPVMHVDFWPVILICVYAVVTGFLFLRFVVNISRIIRLIRNNPSVKYGSARLVLVEEDRVPYSFLNYIFLNREAYAGDTVEREVYHHEMEHVRQRHSIDIILMELAMVFLWFNPILYLYRKAIQLNHEFLADEAVIHSFRDPIAYQFLLLNKIRQSSGLAISSSFNYKVTKKRLVMITKHTTKKVTIFKALAVLPVMGAAVFMFSTRTVAQAPAPVNEVFISGTPTAQVNAADTTPKRPEVVWQGELAGGTKEGVSDAMLKEYQDISDKYLQEPKQGQKKLSLSTEDRDRLKTIFKQMSKKQQLEQDIIFGPPFKALSKKVPTAEQMKAFSDPNVYGIWIDDKKVSNDAIGAYQNTDISWYMISNLYGAAKKGRKYKYQLNIMTNAYFNSQNEKGAKNPEPPMLIRIKTRPKSVPAS